MILEYDAIRIKAYAGFTCRSCALAALLTFRSLVIVRLVSFRTSALVTVRLVSFRTTVLAVISLIPF